MATFTGIGAAFGGFFGAQDLEDAYEEALHEYRLFKANAEKSLEGYRVKGGETYERYKTGLTSPEMAPDIADARKFLMTSLQAGLSPAAQLYMEDANRFLEGRAASTGNLRSGAIGLQRAMLGQRVVSDEFSRALDTVTKFRQGDIAQEQILGQAALGYGNLENIALGTLGSALPMGMGAQVGKGMAEYAQSVALGQGIGGIFDKAEEYYTGGASQFGKKVY